MTRDIVGVNVKIEINDDNQEGNSQYFFGAKVVEASCIQKDMR